MTRSKRSIAGLSVLFATVFACAHAIGKEAADPARPPLAAVKAVTDTYHGIDVVDPYRWMEDAKSPETQAWMKAQAEHADRYLKSLPERDAILRELLDLGQRVEHAGSIQRRGDRWLYLRLASGASTPDLVMRPALGAPEQVLFDPATFGADGERWSIGSYSGSPDGRHVLVQIAAGGNEQLETRVIETATGRDLGLRITRTYGDDLYAPQWLDDRSFLYFRLRELPPDAAPTELYAKSRAYLHRLPADGDATNDPDQDRAIFGFEVDPAVRIAPELVSGVYAPAGSDWLVARANSTVSKESEYWIAPRAALDSDARIPWRRLAALADKVEQVELRGNTAYLLSFRDAPRRQVLRLSLRRPDLAKATIIAPERRAVLDRIAVTRDALYVQGQEAGMTRLWRVDEARDALVPVQRDEEGSAYLVPGAMDATSDVFVYTQRSYTRGRSYGMRKSAEEEAIDLALVRPDSIDRSDIELKLVHVSSHDGVEVPVMLAYRRGLERDGRNPTFVYGYGAYGISMIDPGFWPELLPLLRRGGVLAVAGVRGGGEYGEQWHLAGKQATKPNTWKDAIAVAEWLTRERYTAPAHLSIGGGSAGGILAGNAITERPDLFAAAVIQVGLTNPLRFESTANGATNLPELGSVATREGFEALRAMDAYHKVRDDIAYPAVLLTHGINDPRVEPWFSAKMAARLQAATSSDRPVLLRIDYSAGHGIGSSREQALAEAADMFAFLLHELRSGEDDQANTTPTAAQ